MVHFRSSIPVGHHMNMAKFEQFSQSNKSSKTTPISACEQSPSALIDLIILIAVIGASGFLISPCIILLSSETLKILQPIASAIQQELSNSPTTYSCLGLAIFTTLMAVLALTLCTNRKCGRPGCRGLQKAAEFDIELETEDCINNSDSDSTNLGMKTGLFELPREYFRELESELKKVAPVNGRAVIEFRARCGCSVGRMEVPGPKKNVKKMKK